jgi:hypothetical protein
MLHIVVDWIVNGFTALLVQAARLHDATALLLKGEDAELNFPNDPVRGDLQARVRAILTEAGVRIPGEVRGPCLDQRKER